MSAAIESPGPAGLPAGPSPGSRADRAGQADRAERASRAERAAGGTDTSVPLAQAGPPASWVTWLGENVQIEAPAADPAANTPQGVVAAYAEHLVSADGGSACDYLVATASAYCAHGYSMNVEADDDVTYAYQSFGLGYAAVYDGKKALVGTVRTDLCDHPVENNCVADNQNPGALLDSGQSFAALWREAHHPDGSYTLTPLVKENGTWYIDTAAILGG